MLWKQIVIGLLVFNLIILLLGFTLYLIEDFIETWRMRKNVQ